MELQFVLTLIVLVTSAQCEVYTSVVETDIGPVRGRYLYTTTELKQFSAFLGIPYAEPPLGDLRFAVKFPNPDKPYPVMIWIYGGAFLCGANHRIFYGPDLLIEDDVIVVAMNYRLGPLGFMSLGIKDCPGNQGLKDQRLAMQWVQRNIAKFGGDPNLVTIFGESAGSASTSYHLMSHNSRGLFHRVILQSGTPLCTWTYQTERYATMKAQELAKRTGILDTDPEQILEKLKNTELHEIMNAAADMGSVIYRVEANFPFVPTTESADPDEAVITECPLSYFESGDVADVPIMLGYNHNEAILFTAVPDDVQRIIFNEISSGLNLAGLNFAADFAQLATNITGSSFGDLTYMITTYFFRSPIDLSQQMLARRNSDKPVFYYQLSYSVPTNLHRFFEPTLSGTSHIDDIGQIFQTFGSPIDPYNPENVRRKQFVKLWTNFAKYGNPTPPGKSDVVWLDSKSGGLQMQLEFNNFHMTPREIDEDSVNFVQKPFIKTLPILQNCRNNILEGFNIFDTIL
ncbi:Acetylcholinesterase [Dufourea novaeangliae]|uniref:Carboxylic ester hydrolase n=1 Tax=Dufourea novaeangliae TaxID=178035 RepID=A0A154NZ30_DUFNO|nr:Acetylcholinesterase [Dufourea novaeangliae]